MHLVVTQFIIAKLHEWFLAVFLRLKMLCGTGRN